MVHHSWRVSCQCLIIAKLLRKYNCLFFCCQDDEFVVFPDIRPAAPHHYLIVPRHHYIDVKNLSADHIPMGKGPADILHV